MDGDGVRVVEASRVRSDVWLVVAIGLLGVVALVVVRSALRAGQAEAPEQPAATAAGEPRVARADSEPPTAAGSNEAVHAPAPTAAAPAVRATPRRRRAADRPPPASPTADEAAGAAEPPAAANELTGIAVFPPPGTDPPRPGIVVPEDFALPPGYVRHHQTTDDGERLPPILMFHPDYEWVDERGAPIALPADHVVPPELAPPGLPITVLRVPETKIPLVEERPRGTRAPSP